MYVNCQIKQRILPKSNKSAKVTVLEMCVLNGNCLIYSKQDMVASTICNVSLLKDRKYRGYGVLCFCVSVQKQEDIVWLVTLLSVVQYRMIACPHNGGNKIDLVSNRDVLDPITSYSHEENSNLTLLYMYTVWESKDNIDNFHMLQYVETSCQSTVSPKLNKTKAYRPFSFLSFGELIISVDSS